MNVHKGWAFSRGIYSEVHSPVTTPDIICIMALTLQPIRGCPRHFGVTGTRLSSAVHRISSPDFSLGNGYICTQATPEEELLSELPLPPRDPERSTPHPMGISVKLKNSSPRNHLVDNWPTVCWKGVNSSCDLIKGVSANCQLKTIG